MKSEYDVVVIGGGPGGYVAAVRAAQLGCSVALVEKSELGGVCLNWGCVPSKNIIHQASLFRSLDEMEAIGVTIDRAQLDYAKVKANSRAVVEQLRSGVSGLLKKNKVDVYSGSARLLSARTIQIDSAQELQTNNIILATGSSPIIPLGFEVNEIDVLSSTGALDLDALPKSMIILGGGAIGVEFAYILRSFGVDVTLIEAASQLLPGADEDVAKLLSQSLQEQGVSIHVATRASAVIRSDSGVVVSLESQAGVHEDLMAEKALVVFGRRPNTKNLGLENIGVSPDKTGHLAVDEYGQICPGVYAIGDITASAALAHVASYEGEVAAEHIAAAGNVQNLKTVEASAPLAVYCEPQVASFGHSEATLADLGIPFEKRVFNYLGAGKSVAIGKTKGFVKVLFDPQTQELLGAHIIGYNATELIHELHLVKTAELLPEDVASMIHAHPTISEIIPEVFRSVIDRPIHG